jgi:hypothetical protein
LAGLKYTATRQGKEDERDPKLDETITILVATICAEVEGPSPGELGITKDIIEERYGTNVNREPRV